MRNGIWLAVVVMSLTASRWASAEEAQPQPGEPPAEVGLAAEQIALGTVSAAIAATSAFGFALSQRPREYAVSSAFMAAAVLPGLAVCANGATSRFYDGSCLGPIVGAYIGLAAVAIPVGLAAQGSIFRSSENDSLNTGVVAFVWISAAVGSAVGATIGWHLTKHRRPTPANVARVQLPPVPRAPWPEMPLRQLAQAPGSVAFPVLAFTF